MEPTLVGDGDRLDVRIVLPLGEIFDGDRLTDGLLVGETLDPLDLRGGGERSGRREASLELRRGGRWERHVERCYSAERNL